MLYLAVKSASFILLQGVPATVPLDTVKESMQNVSGVLSIHELHIWQLSESKIVASVHVLVECSSAQTERYMDIATEIRRVLHSWGVHSSTIQPEFVPGGIRQAARMSGVDLSQTEVDEHGRLITGDGTLIESELVRRRCPWDAGCFCLLIRLVLRSASLGTRPLVSWRAMRTVPVWMAHAAHLHPAAPCSLVEALTRVLPKTTLTGKKATVTRPLVLRITFPALLRLGSCRSTVLGCHELYCVNASTILR